MWSDRLSAQTACLFLIPDLKCDNAFQVWQQLFEGKRPSGERNVQVYSSHMKAACHVGLICTQSEGKV